MLNAKLILILNFIHKNGDGRNLVAIFYENSSLKNSKT